MEDLLQQWTALAGFAALAALLINIGKAAGIVKDGQAPLWSAGLNLLGLAGLLAARVLAPGFDLAGLDVKVQALVQVGAAAFDFVLMLLGSKAAHMVLRGAPLVGKSFSTGGR